MYWETTNNNIGAGATNLSLWFNTDHFSSFIHNLFYWFVQHIGTTIYGTQSNKIYNPVNSLIKEIMDYMLNVGELYESVYVWINLLGVQLGARCSKDQGVLKCKMWGVLHPNAFILIFMKG